MTSSTNNIDNLLLSPSDNSSLTIEYIRFLSNQNKLLNASIETLRIDMADNTNAFFLVTMAVIIFLMQCGFAFLEAGAVRSKNTTNILIKNLLDSCFAAICYWAVGWAFAYGQPINETLGLFVGQSEFFLIGTTKYAQWFFQFVFAATASTIISGAVAERCEFIAYMCYCAVVAGFVYPIVTHWGWDANGWLKKGLTSDAYGTISYIDFAGAGMVHVLGGTASLIAAALLGPRIGRFPTDGSEKTPEIQGHSVPFTALGGFILMFGFLAFNGGSQGQISARGDGSIVALAMTNTILSGAAAAIILLVISKIRFGKWTLLGTINAALAGMVSACAGCNQMHPWASILVGVGSGTVYMLLAALAVKFKIDDPLDAFAVHFGGGAWGLMIAPILIDNGLLQAIIAIGSDDPDKPTVAHASMALMWNLVATIAIVIWTTIVMFPMFFILKKLGLFRVSREVETKGLDLFLHGESAYPLLAYGHGWDVDRKHSIISDSNPEISLEELALQYHKKTSAVYPESQRPNVRSRSNNSAGGGLSFETPEQDAMKKWQKINKNTNGSH